MPVYDILAKHIRKVRKEMKLSQLEFSLECGISIDIISQIERQKTNPRLSTLQKIAAYTGQRVADLLIDEEENK